MVSSEASDAKMPRRDFLKSSASITTAALAANALGTNFAYAQADDKLRVGLIGCGGRGTGAARDCVNAAPNVEIYALGDVFEDRLNSCRNALQQALKNSCNVTEERCFTGFDNYQRVLETDVDMVILATPPGFRPQQFKASVEAGKHVFMEKPVAVCPAGVREVMAAGKVAEEKGLGVVAGTLYRHHTGYRETIKRLHEGAIGEILSAQAYYLTGGLWMNPRRPEWSDIEWQIRNWLYFTWLSGDHIVEQHIHNLDVINWVMGSPPVKCLSMGGRQARTDPAYGHIYDHFGTEYEYPGGVKVWSMCRQIGRCTARNTNHIIGSEGTSNPGGSIRGKVTYDAPREGLGPAYVREHTDLINSIRAGEPLNESQQIAESTLTAVMARMSAYTGKEVSWEFALNESQLNLMREVTEFGDMPVDPVAIPGKTELI
ncbi:MAG: Gfo/Idh/MocA family protein [Armatimonadota bacterium]